MRPVECARMLPVQPTPIIGRAREIRSIVQCLRCSETRLLTISGPPGVGKTRLALAAAEVLDEEFQSGVVFVNLAPIRDAGLFEPTLIQTLGSEDSPPGRLWSDSRAIWRTVTSCCCSTTLSS